MRNVFAALSVVAACGAVTINTASAYEYAECTYSVTGVAYNDVLNIRAWPSPKSRIVGHIPPNGEGVEIVRRKGRWGLVEYDGIEGWSHTGYLREVCE